MPDISQEQIDKRFDELVPPLQNSLFDPDVLSRLVSAAARLKLSEDNQDALLFIFGQVIMGFIPLDQMSAALVADTGLPESQTKMLADEIRRDIFTRLGLEKLLHPAPGAPAASDRAVPSANVLNLKRAPAVVSAPTPLRSAPLPAFPPRPATPFSSSPATPSSLTPIPSRPLPNPLNQINSSPSTTLPPQPPAKNSFSIFPPVSMPATPASPTSPPKPALNSLNSPAGGTGSPIHRDFLRQPSPQTPFVLHRESEVKPITRLPLTSSSAVSRIESSDSSSAPQQSSTHARVEIGNTIRAKRREELSRPTRTSPSQNRPIDYSALSTAPRDPFSNIKTPAPSGASSPSPSSLPPVPPSPKSSASSPSQSPPSGPRLTGNTVDLRQKN